MELNRDMRTKRQGRASDTWVRLLSGADSLPLTMSSDLVLERIGFPTPLKGGE